MQSASTNPRIRLALVPGLAWERTRAAVPGAVLWSALLVFLLTFTFARSTVTASWVSGIDVIVGVALGGALLMAVLAVLPMPWGAALVVGLLLGPVVAAVAAGPALHAAHPLDPALLTGNGISSRLVNIWLTRLTDGSAANDTAFYLFVICWLMWTAGGWLSWCVLRWRRPMLGLIPGAAAFATNLLNFPTDQNGFTLAFLVLTLALLLWSNYTGSIASARRARVKLTGDARWDFWESGLVAMAALIVLGIMLPPMSTVDRTVSIESSALSSWAQFQERLSHPGVPGTGTGAIGSTGFSTDVSLGGALKRNKDIVFTYTITGDYAAPHYFRGVNETVTSAGQWRYSPRGGAVLVDRIAKNTTPQYLESYQKLGLAIFNIKMILPPIGNTDVLFYPGQFFRGDRATIANQIISPAEPPAQSIPIVDRLSTIDRLSTVAPANSAGTYNITAEYSTATAPELAAAGTNYPAWLLPYMSLPTETYRSPEVVARIKQLAVQITTAAGAQTPYDEAAAIEAYLRNPNNYTYTLTPPQPPQGVDPLSFFLFTSKKGYCEYFATAMGDMLRSLGIPTRLVNGFGAGIFDTPLNRYIVRSEDAHTWVESYFPGYGWIPFEPTADGTYFPVPRGTPPGSNVCLHDNNCDPGTPAGTGGVVGIPTGRTGGNLDAGTAVGGSTGFVLRALDAGTLTRVVGVLIAIILLLLGLAARYLRPRTTMGVWKRTLMLAQLAGAEQRPGETPLELGRRLARLFPEASEPVRSLAGGFAVAAYAPPELARSARASVMEAWLGLRPMLLRRVVARFRPNRT